MSFEKIKISGTRIVLQHCKPSCAQKVGATPLALQQRHMIKLIETASTRVSTCTGPALVNSSFLQGSEQATMQAVKPLLARSVCGPP